MKKVALFVVLLGGIIALAAKPSTLVGSGADPVPQCPDPAGCLTK